MEFGASFSNEVIYMADFEIDSSEAFDEFKSRVGVWTETHGIVLGEGTTKVITNYEPPLFSFKLIAPRIEGPFPFTSRIS